jgi:hypothetical protein
MPGAANATPAPLIAPPTIAVARGRVVGDPISRHEFHRTDTLVVRVLVRSSGASAAQAETNRTPVVTGRLLNARGLPLTDLPLTSAADAPELRLALGNLSPADYVIEFTARSGDETAQQYVAFRVMR